MTATTVDYPGHRYAPPGGGKPDVHGVHAEAPGVHDAAQVAAAERTLTRGTWAITAGAVLFSVLTVTPLVERVTPDGWDWTAPILPIVVDAAVVIVVRLDAALARLDGKGGPWPALLRWLTGIMTLALNVGDSALKGDLVGVAVHAVAPLLLIVTAEAALAYRRALAAAVSELEERATAERERTEQRARQAAQAAREEREREREHAARLERERAQRAAEHRREEREHQAALRREEREQAEARERAERAERERERIAREHQAAERERREREEAEREHQAAAREHERIERERAARAQWIAELLAADPVTDKREESEARAIVRAAYETAASVRTAARLTGWSVGWVSDRYQELRDQSVPTTPRELEGAAA
jgi:flagellar biosynthesis GTPase FlhF